MTLPENRIYLASRSPRRRELLKQIGVSFATLLLRETLPRLADVDEAALPDEAPVDYVCRIARKKAGTGWAQLIQRKLPPLPVLAADTIVVLNGCVFGKPESSARAQEMLIALSGQTHEGIDRSGGSCAKWNASAHLCFHCAISQNQRTRNQYVSY